MADVLSENKHEYVLEFPPERQIPAVDESQKMYDILSDTLLSENIVWYCRFRWVMISFLIVFGLFSTLPRMFDNLYLHSNLAWPFVIAGMLVAFNFTYLIHANRLHIAHSSRGIRFNIWSQIFIDLILLTLVVHFVGSLETFVSFTYLYHIVLACIFFPRMQSFFVTLMASIFFLVCISLEISMLVPPSSIYIFSVSPHIAARDPLNVIIPILSILVNWFVVWYLVSHLSSLVKKRDIKLIETNYSLLKRYEEEKKHVRWLAHEMKAPLAAIDANLHLLKDGQFGMLPEKAESILERIAARSKKLGHEIQEMLQLANVRTARKESLRMDSLDVSEVISDCLGQLSSLTEKRGILFEMDLRSSHILADADYMKILFLNIISNAITYSHPNGAVRIECHPVPDSGPIAVIEDHGIGIMPGKLDRIFDEYYHTTEAVLHNKNSTGLGLAIVKHISHMYNISIRVVSMPGWGTSFELRFPSPRSHSSGTDHETIREISFEH